MMSGKLLAKVSLCVTIVFTAGCAAIVPGLNLKERSDLRDAPTNIGGYDFFHITPKNVRIHSAQASNYGVTVGGAEFSPQLSVNESSLNSSVRADYRIRAGDVLSIIVWEHPELTSPTGEFRDPVSSGRLVNAEGQIFYPYVGELQVDGLTSSQVRRLISSRLARVVRNPQIDVRVASFRSQKFQVLGQVRNAGVYPITDSPLTILEAISQAGGLTDSAVSTHVKVVRGGNSYIVPLHMAGLQNPEGSHLYMRDGDSVVALDSRRYPVYVMGAVRDEVAVPVTEGTITLAQAISSAGGFDVDRARNGSVYVVRTQQYVGVDRNHQASISRPSVYRLELGGVSSLLLLNAFELMASDIVYVDTSGIATFNSVVKQILPSVSTLFQVDALLRRD